MLFASERVGLVINDTTFSMCFDNHKFYGIYQDGLLIITEYNEVLIEKISFQLVDRVIKFKPTGTHSLNPILESLNGIELVQHYDSYDNTC